MLRRARKVIPRESCITLYNAMMLPIFDYLKRTLVFKCLNNLAPPYLLNKFSHSRDFHSYNIRHRDLLRPPLAKTTKYQGSFRFSETTIWNSLPLDLRRAHDLNKFKSVLKKHLRSS